MKPVNIGCTAARRAVSLAGVVFLCGALVWAQTAPPPPIAQPDTQAPGAQILGPQQLDNLVAPIALYPDPLLGQVLAAATYPLEIVEAEQFVQANRGMQSQQLI